MRQVDRRNVITMAEWRKAAYFTTDKNGTGLAGYYEYPTGSDDVPDGISFDGDTTFDAVFNDGFNQGHPNDVDNAGLLSPYGTMGQGANLRESLEDWAAEGGGAKYKVERLFRAESGILGSFLLGLSSLVEHISAEWS